MLKDERLKCELTDSELIKKGRQMISNLCKSGATAWTMRVPPDPNNDSDFILMEVIDRFEKLSHENNT